MKKLTLLLLLLISPNVLAEWVKLDDGHDAKNITVYVDKQSILKEENKVQMWSLYDHKTAFTIGNKVFLSAKKGGEYDCEKATAREIEHSLYSENMGAGKLVFSQNNIKTESIPIVPKTIKETLFKIACGKQ
jgi:hypothetical protein